MPALPILFARRRFRGGDGEDNFFGDMYTGVMSGDPWYILGAVGLVAAIVLYVWWQMRSDSKAE